MGSRGSFNPVLVRKMSRWVRRRTMWEKVSMGVIATIILFMFLNRCLFRRKQHYFHITSRCVHAVGLLVLLYKLYIQKTCAGLSLKSQELSAIYLVVRFLYNLLGQEIYIIVLDMVVLGATLWVIHLMRGELKSTYMKELDTMPLYYVLVPCIVAGLLAYGRPGNYGFFYAFALSVEAFSVLPQLRVIQNAKMVEPFTGHYVFALGVSRFFSFATWMFEIIRFRGMFRILIGQGHFLILLIIVYEVVHTFILADFCYYYVKSVIEGQRRMSLPILL